MFGRGGKTNDISMKNIDIKVLITNRNTAKPKQKPDVQKQKQAGVSLEKSHHARSQNWIRIQPKEILMMNQREEEE